MSEKVKDRRLLDSILVEFWHNRREIILSHLKIPIFEVEINFHTVSPPTSDIFFALKLHPRCVKVAPGLYI